MRHRIAVLLTLCLLLAGLVGSTVLWLRAQRRQYALNRALIAALVEGDNKQALALVNEGADPNTRYKPAPVPSLPERVKQMLHRSPQPANNSETALSLACGAAWDDEYVTSEVQQHRPEDVPLVQVMLTHGATVNVKDEVGASPLIWTAFDNRPKTTRLLLEHGANLNLADKDGVTPLMWAQLANRPDIVALFKQYSARKPTKRP